ncbi:unnamed protein product [Vicia faba]|uniref:Ankyrin repeat protein n=1 Tax=Vicia faba TaxID=3906 RepID=A0AAV0ZVF3_VICFA|nr:unnamed protein product [Vicia faba]
MLVRIKKLLQGYSGIRFKIMKEMNGLTDESKFAALKGNDLLLHQLLKRGLDPNESDNNERTTLHIATFKEKENCVLLLLDYGANPNIRDSGGNIALWEAILGGHETITKHLVRKGATLQSGDVVVKDRDILKMNKITRVLNYVGFGLQEL